ncbi:glycoside hydrolase family 30 beta sandwich domain-containing protein [Hymenobacter agri]
MAFRTPAGQRVLLVLNDGTTAQTFRIRQGGQQAVATLPAGAVGTYAW